MDSRTEMPGCVVEATVSAWAEYVARNPNPSQFIPIGELPDDAPDFIKEAAAKIAGFHEDWFSEASQVVLADLIGQTADVDGAIIEVGSWEGRSTIALANAAYPDIVHAVDTWKGSPGEISSELAKQRDVYTRFLTNIAEYTRGNVNPYRMGWRHYFIHRMWETDSEAKGIDPPRKIRLLFIDAEHTYKEVRENIEKALPHMAPGGIICGDDAHHPPIRRAVLDMFPTAKVAASVWLQQI